MTDIGAKEAAQALSDIEAIVQRVRQSRIYDLASQIMIAAGVLVLAGNLANFVAPSRATLIWVAVNVLTVASVAALSLMGRKTAGVQSFDLKVLAAFLLFYGFGILCSVVLGQYGPRELGAFWPIYFMLFYCIAGLWFGRAFIFIGFAITVLTLIGYFFIMGAAFLWWMAAVNGGGLILSGLWMRRI
ncbi:MAG TPA: hypothetical protein VFL62_14290 [Bradyrhizobium sp.]|uniref:hypothetical protein n=1 Tax=Bradyrhizobium sp. TaxID=376 RepID=UPI002D7E1B7D|nr:hypothetical protein [Bradyrhizobium sp.]HET7887395.1 hypothetical protein [Bradyrhizobium sp.]